MKRLLFGLLVGLIVSSYAPVFADGNLISIGDKFIMEGGYESVCIGFGENGEPIYQVDLSTPKYLDDLTTPIDTEWHVDNSGNYQAGENYFNSYVSGEFVNVSDDKLNTLSWQPSVNISNIDKSKDNKSLKLGKLNVSQSKARILSVDPLNPNYKNNTLEWDYGKGIVRRLRIIEGVQQEYYVITSELAADLTITHNANKNGVESNKPVAYDADNKPVELTLDANHNISISKSKFSAAKYPIIIDPDVTFTSTASDGGISKADAVYANARTAASGDSLSVSSSQSSVNNSLVGNYSINRSFVYFDTSVLSGYVITAATLDLYCTSKSDTDTESIQIQSGMPTYPHDPLVLGDYDLTNYATDTNSGVKTIATFNTGAYNSITLDASGLAEINTTGITKFALRTTGDITNTPPTGENWVLFYTYEQGVGYRPRLVVTFTATAPTIISVAASNITTEGARLNGTVTDDGSSSMLVENADVRFGYGVAATLADTTGTATGAPITLLPNTVVNTVVVTGAGTFTITIPAGHTGVATSGTATLTVSPDALAAGANVVDTGATTGNFTVTVTLSNFLNYTTVSPWVAGYYTGGNPYLDITGLTSGLDYYFNVQVKNTISTVTATTERMFATLISVDDISQFVGTPSSTSIKLNWTKSSGSTRTLIRYKTTGYPANTADGTVVYFNTSSSTEHSSLTAGTTYYYSAWGETGGTYSTNPINLAMTTNAGTTLDTTPDGVMPASWWQAPNESFLVNIEPIYSVINGLADSWGMPRGNMWLALSLFFVTVVGAGLYIKFKSPSFALVVMSFLIIGFVVLHILPSFLLFIVGFLMLGAWSTRPSVG